MKPFLHVSASQISSFRLCARKWWLEKIAGISSPPSQAQIDGAAWAKEAESYFMTDNTDFLSPTTLPLLGLVASGRIPAPRTRPGSTLRVEHPIGADTRDGVANTVQGFTLAGIPVVGFMDLFDLREDAPVVWDQKTSAGRQWVKTEEELTRDPQLNLYAYSAVLQHSAAFGHAPEAVDVGHIVLLKPPRNAPEAILVGPVRLTVDHIDAQLRGLDATVRQMKVVALAETPIGVTPTVSACSAFGGCPHRDTCKSLSTIQSSGVSDMSLIARLAAAKASSPAPVAAPVAAPAPVAAAPTGGLAARLAANLRKPGQLLPPDAPASTVVASLPVAPAVQQVAAPARNPVIVAAEAAVSSAVRQPRNGDKRLAALGWTESDIASMSVARKHEVLDGALTPPVVEAEPEFIDWDLNSVEALERGIMLGWSESQLQTTMSDEALTRVLMESLQADAWTLNDEGTDFIARIKVAEAVAAAPARRERAPKAAPVAPAPVAAPILEERLFGGRAPIDVDPAPVEAAPAAPAAGWPLVLYIDCRPVKGVSYIELHDHLQPAMRGIESTKKIAHWDAAPYNEGQKLLAASLLLEPVKGHLVVNSKAPYANYCLDVLLGQATIVVRA